MGRDDGEEAYEQLICHLTQRESSYLEECTPYSSKVAATVNGTTTAALVDSGNLYRSAISVEFLQRLGLTKDDIKPTKKGGVIQTAKTGSALTILGELRKPLSLRLGTCQQDFVLSPVVLENFGMELNLAGPFLRANNIDQIHSQQILRWNGETIQLLQPNVCGEIDPHDHDVLMPIYTEHETTIPTDSCQVLDVRVINKPGVRQGLIYGDAEFEKTYQLNTMRRGLISCDSAGKAKVLVLNLSGRPIRVKSNQRYGHLLPVYETTPKTTTTAMNIASLAKEDPAATLRRIRKAFNFSGATGLRSPEEKLQLEDLLCEYADIFAWDDQPGTTHLVEHSIDLVPGAKPTRDRHRTLNPSLQDSLRKQLDQWVVSGVIEESCSPFNAALVAVRKPATGEIRWCIDYRRLNSVTVRDTYSIGDVSDNLSRLSGSDTFSSLDAVAAFNHVPIRKEDREKTAFSAGRFGTFQFRKMPFGLMNAGATYARLVEKVLGDLPHEVALPFLDDTLVHSKGFQQHLANLRLVFQRHREAGIKLKPKKCRLCVAEVDYLGHTIDKRGVRPIAEYTEVVTRWPIPTTKKEVRVFLAKVGYYRRYIQDFAKTASPLFDVLGEQGLNDHEKFQPSDAIQAATEELKTALTRAPILAHPDFESKEPFILDTDYSTSNRAMGAVLSQIQDGQERVIAYVGKRLNKAQQSYPAFKGELFAAMYFISKMKYYLLHRRFVLRTDNTALKYVQTLKDPGAIIENWLHILANYDFIVEHRGTKKHANADALSRAEHLEEIEIDDVPEGYVCHMNGDANREVMRPRLTEEADIGPEVWAEKQREDEDLSILIECMNDPALATRQRRALASPTLQHYFGFYDEGSLCFNDAGVLMVKKEVNEPGLSKQIQVALTPVELQETAMLKAHLGAGHQGWEKTLQLALKHFYFLNMKNCADRVIRECVECQRKTGAPKQQRHTLEARADGYPFQTVSIDFVGPLDKTPRGNMYILTLLDTFTRWIEAYAVKRATAETVVDKLINDFIPRFSVPHSIHSDRGTTFTSRLTQEVAEHFGIRWTFTSSYNPKANPVERTHRDIGNALRAHCASQPTEWDKYLPQILFAIRATNCRTTGLSPYSLMFGRPPNMPLELITQPIPVRESYRTHQEYFDALQQATARAHRFARENISSAITRQKTAYFRKAAGYNPGDSVWLFTPRFKPGPRKLRSYWTGPWTVHRKINPTTYEISPKTTWLRSKKEVVSIDRLKKYFGEVDEIPPNLEDDLRMIGDEHCQNITVEETPAMSVAASPAPKRSRIMVTTEGNEEEEDDEPEPVPENKDDDGKGWPLVAPTTPATKTTPTKKMSSQARRLQQEAEDFIRTVRPSNNSSTARSQRLQRRNLESEFQK